MFGGRKLAIIDTLLDLAQRDAEEAEVFQVVRNETSVLFESNRLKSLETSQTEGMALRVIKNGRVGFSSTTDLNDLQGLSDKAVEVAAFGAKAKFHFPKLSQYPDVPVYDSGIDSVSDESLVRLGQNLMAQLRAQDKEINLGAQVSCSETRIVISNTAGGQTSYAKTVFGVGAWGTIVRGTDMLFISDSEESCRPIGCTKGLESSLAKQLENSRYVSHVSTGELPVVFTPIGVAGVLVAPLVAGLNGKTVLDGASPLTNRLGDCLTGHSFSLIDDPTLPFVPRSRQCDDEGVPSQRIPLIAEGKVANFYYDLQTAGEAGCSSTGSGSRSLGSLPAPGVGVLVIPEGDVPNEEMIEGIEEGIVVERLLGAGQGNTLGGDFSANVLLGYKIERGRLVGRVKNTMISGNIYRALENLSAVGQESRWVGGSLNTPPILCTNVLVAATK